MKIVVIGLTITSSWGNGHATTYRALLKALASRGHEIVFMEKDVPYYAGNRDMPEPDFCKVLLYQTNEEIKENYSKIVALADVVIIGSYVQQGVEIGNWAIKTATGITAFYDIDTPVTLAKLEREDYEYLDPEIISKYNLFLSFCGGPVLNHLEDHYRSPMARALYCSVDPEIYYPQENEIKWQMGYLGTFSIDRQPSVQELLNEPAMQYPKGKFVVAGPQYPANYEWAQNVERIDHLPPAKHRSFYNSQKFTLNVTRQDMIKAGFSPSVRLFEAAACGVAIISDYWEGIDSIFEIDKEILIARSSREVLGYFKNISEPERKEIGKKARQKILKYHTAQVRAKELENYVKQVQELSKV